MTIKACWPSIYCFLLLSNSTCLDISKNVRKYLFTDIFVLSNILKKKMKMFAPVLLLKFLLIAKETNFDPVGGPKFLFSYFNREIKLHDL